MLEAIKELIGILEGSKIRYCVIGGVAVLLYGGRASTLDFDFYLLTEDLEKLLKALRAHGAKVNRAGEHQLKGRFKSLPIDVLLADEWLGQPALKRARLRKFLSTRVRVARPEDLIVMKSISDRPVDRRDIEEIRELFKGRIDEVYVRRRLKAIRTALER